MKRKEISELAGLIGFDEVKKEIEAEKNLEKWAKRCTNHFTRREKRMLFGEIDNIVWSGKEGLITEWSKKNKVYDEITEDEIEELWNQETPGEDEPIRLNGKYVWATAKRVCDFINAHEDLIQIKSFGEYRVVMKKVTRVIKEAHNTERKRRHTTKKKVGQEVAKRTQRAKALIATIKQGNMRKEDAMKRLDEIFGKGSGHEIEKATTDGKIVERIEKLSKREAQLEEWERMRRESKRKQREDGRLNIFWRKNKTFPAQFGGDEETPDAEETLQFWRSVNHKQAADEWKEDRSIREVLYRVKKSDRERKEMSMV